MTQAATLGTGPDVTQSVSAGPGCDTSSSPLRAHQRPLAVFSTQPHTADSRTSVLPAKPMPSPTSARLRFTRSSLMTHRHSLHVHRCIAISRLPAGRGYIRTEQSAARVLIHTPGVRRTRSDTAVPSGHDRAVFEPVLLCLRLSSNSASRMFTTCWLSAVCLPAFVGSCRRRLIRG